MWQEGEFVCAGVDFDSCPRGWRRPTLETGRARWAMLLRAEVSPEATSRSSSKPVWKTPPCAGGQGAGRGRSDGHTEGAETVHPLTPRGSRATPQGLTLEATRLSSPEAPGASAELPAVAAGLAALGARGHPRRRQSGCPAEDETPEPGEQRVWAGDQERRTLSASAKPGVKRRLRRKREELVQRVREFVGEPSLGGGGVERGLPSARRTGSPVSAMKGMTTNERNSRFF